MDFTLKMTDFTNQGGLTSILGPDFLMGNHPSHPHHNLIQAVVLRDRLWFSAKRHAAQRIGSGPGVPS